MNGYLHRMGAARASGVRAESQTVVSLRAANRASVLRTVLRERQTTRAEVARQCGLSAASAANIVAELIEDGLVAEVGSMSSRGGRPIALIAPNADRVYAIGADVGERGVAVELFDLSLTMVDREFRGGREQETVEGIYADLDAAVTALHERNGARWARVLGIGLGLPGVVETVGDGVQTLYAQSLGWPAHTIPDEIGGLPVYAENGATTEARAELWFGAARGVEHAAVALLGRGVGLGLIADGRLYRGLSGSATEWGHTKIHYGGRRCRCGDQGCVEAYVGADAVLDAWRSAGGDVPGSGWQAIGALLTTADEDPVASAVLDDAIEALGAALGSIVNLVNPQRVIVGGWVGLRLMERHADRILAAVRRNCLHRAAEQFDLLPATFGGDTVALGSALMPIEAFIENVRSEPTPAAG
jgi:predicted NBD/HSP70 family sugar kinase